MFGAKKSGPEAVGLWSAFRARTLTKSPLGFKRSSCFPLMEHSQTAERLVGLIPGMHARERRQRIKGPTPAPRGIGNRDEEKHEDERKKECIGE